jgi:hypothetical protein
LSAVKFYKKLEIIPKEKVDAKVMTTYFNRVNAKIRDIKVLPIYVMTKA